MKSPREILFHRHNPATPQLDQVRRTVLNKLQRAATEPQHTGSSSLASVLFKPWTELFVPARRVWTALGAAWVLIIVLNLVDADDSSPRYAQTERQPVSQDALVNWMRQQQVLAELAEPRREKEADRPRPRSEGPFPMRSA